MHLLHEDLLSKQTRESPRDPVSNSFRAPGFSAVASGGLRGLGRHSHVQSGNVCSGVASARVLEFVPCVASVCCCCECLRKLHSHTCVGEPNENPNRKPSFCY